MLKAHFRFDETHWKAAISVASRARQNVLRQGMEGIAKSLVLEAQLRCPVDTGYLEKDYRLDLTGQGWSKRLGSPWETRLFNYKVIWGEKTAYSKEMDENLEIGTSMFSFNLETGEKHRLSWEKDPTYRLDKKSVQKNADTSRFQASIADGLGSGEDMKVGGKFLSRAYRAHTKVVRQRQDALFAELNLVVDHAIKTVREKGTGRIARVSSRYKNQLYKLQKATEQIKVN